MRVKITVPATSANLGPGFDCVGLALGLHNQVTFTLPEGGPPLVITTTGVDAHKIPTNEKNMVWQAMQRLFARLGTALPPLQIHQENQIPVGSGLGSSSTAVLAGMLGANVLLGEPLTLMELLEFAVRFEGHPDNVAPALLGGLVLGVMDERLIVERITIPDQQVTIILPDFTLLTSDARAALPERISREDAIFNTSRVALLLQALATGNYETLGVAMQDRLHQPYRLPLIPGMAAAMAAARQAGAPAVALSGAGPSMIAFAPDHHASIALAAAAAFAQAGCPARTWVLPIDHRGAIVCQES